MTTPTSGILIPNTLSPDAVSAARSYLNLGQYAQAWMALADAGDRYADNAAAVIGEPSDTADLFFQTLVKNHWSNTGNGKAYQTEFNNVARDHLNNYITELERGFIPDTQFIVESYEIALSQNGVDKTAAFDGVWAAALPNETLDSTWGIPFLGMALERMTSSQQTNGLSVDDASKVLAVDFLETFADLTKKGLIDDLLVDMASRFGSGVADYLGDLQNNLNNLGHLIGLNLPLPSEINDFFSSSQNWRPARRDPLTLDLDGDGIETTAQTGWNGVLFDHNGDGQKTGTGWLSADDGFLTLDKNNNGIIDNGKELFGDNSLLNNGGIAADGYAALADIDSNQDGVIDATDTDFANLRVWQDINQDGISQASELKTLTQLGIASLSKASVASGQTQNGNTITHTGTYTKTDGSTEQTGNLDLASSVFNTEYTETTTLSAVDAARADMHGAGRVRNLRHAAALSATLATTLDSYSAATSRDLQQGQLDVLLNEWAGTSDMAGLMQRAA